MVRMFFQANHVLGKLIQATHVLGKLIVAVKKSFILSNYLPVSSIKIKKNK